MHSRPCFSYLLTFSQFLPLSLTHTHTLVPFVRCCEKWLVRCFFSLGSASLLSRPNKSVGRLHSFFLYLLFALPYSHILTHALPCEWINTAVLCQSSTETQCNKLIHRTNNMIIWINNMTHCLLMCSILCAVPPNHLNTATESNTHRLTSICHSWNHESWQ